MPELARGRGRVSPASGGERRDRAAPPLAGRSSPLGLLWSLCFDSFLPEPQCWQTRLLQSFKTLPTYLSIRTRCLLDFARRWVTSGSTSSFQTSVAPDSGAAPHCAPFFLMGRIHWVERHGCEFQTQGMSFICFF